MWTAIRVEPVVRCLDTHVAKCLKTFATDVWVVGDVQTNEATEFVFPVIHCWSRHQVRHGHSCVYQNFKICSLLYLAERACREQNQQNVGNKWL